MTGPPAGPTRALDAHWPVVLVVDDADLTHDRWVGTLGRPVPGDPRRAVVVAARPMRHSDTHSDLLPEDLLRALGRAGGADLRSADRHRKTRWSHVLPWLLAADVDDLVLHRAHWWPAQTLSDALEACTAAGIRLWLVAQPLTATAREVVDAYADTTGALTWAQFRAAWADRPRRLRTSCAESGPPAGAASRAGGTRPNAMSALHEVLHDVLPDDVARLGPLALRDGLAAAQADGQDWAGPALLAFTQAEQRANALLSLVLPYARPRTAAGRRGGRYDAAVLTADEVARAALTAATPALAVLAARATQLAAHEHGWHVHVPVDELLAQRDAARQRLADIDPALERSLLYDRHPHRAAMTAVLEAGVPEVLAQTLPLTCLPPPPRRPGEPVLLRAGAVSFTVPAGLVVPLRAHLAVRLLDQAADTDPLLPPNAAGNDRSARSAAGLADEHARRHGVPVGLHRALGCPAGAHRACALPWTAAPLRLNDPALVRARRSAPGPSLAVPLPQRDVSADATALALLAQTGPLDATILRRHPGWRAALDELIDAQRPPAG